MADAVGTPLGDGNPDSPVDGAEGEGLTGPLGLPPDTDADGDSEAPGFVMIA